jgi:uncharacterized phage protein (TIGR02218 family)
MHRLDQEQGRLYRATCAADLGDDCCRVDLDQPAFSASATVTGTDGALVLSTETLQDFTENWFAGGRLAWASGANAGLTAEVKAHSLRVGGGARLELWQRAARPIAIGDTFRVTAGCDKSFATCREKFGNVAKFRGFPHMPGNDFVVRLPLQGEAGMDGGSLFR